MGAAGAGKTTVGRQLATDLGWPFFDADSVHTPEDVARMRAGQPLTDAERAPWLRRVGAAICEIHRQSPDLVVACSALKRHYRDALAEQVPDLRWIYLEASEALLRERLTARRNHFASTGILEAQLADLEPPEDAL